VTAKRTAAGNKQVQRKTTTTKKRASKSQGKSEAAAGKRPYIVGIGSSAGGLEALTNLIRALPTDLGATYVVIQHLSPTHRSMMVQLLGRETAMAVLEVEDGALPQADTIYVTPPSHISADEIMQCFPLAVKQP